MSDNRGSIRAGVLIGITLSVVAITLLAAISASWRTSTGLYTFENPAMAALIFIGVSQVVWMLPAALVLLVMRRVQTFKGLLLVTASVFLLNLAWFIPTFGRRLRL